MKKPIWTKEEEMHFLKDISHGSNIQDLVKQYNRSQSALELRLKKIVFDNIESGKNYYKLSKIVKIPEDTIKQYYYEYKAFLEKKGTLQNEIDKVIKMKQNNDDYIPNKQNKDNRYEQNSRNKNKEAIINKFKKKIRKIERENKIMKEILDNIKFKNNITKLIDQGLIDDKTKRIIKKII